MNWLRRHPGFFGCLAGCAIALAIESLLLGHGAVRARHELALLARKKQERDVLARSSPAPTEAAQRATAQDCAALEKLLSGLRSKLPAPDSPTSNETSVTSSPLEAYFVISQFVEDTRARALAKQVGLKPDERFGLASYAHEGPPAELIPAVNRQRLVLRELLDALIEAQPHELIAVKRERPAAAGLAGGSEVGVATDYFASFRTVEGATTGAAHSQSFLIEFSGSTSVLRDFLCAVAGSGMPLVVRAVEVEPVESNATRDRPPAGALVAVVSPRRSKFSVTVDAVEVPVVISSSP